MLVLASEWSTESEILTLRQTLGSLQRATGQIPGSNDFSDFRGKSREFIHEKQQYPFWKEH